MIQEYISMALSLAKYEIIKNKEPYYAEIKQLPGIWATGRTLEECRINLGDTVEGWILVRIKKGLPIPNLKNRKIIKPHRIAIHA